MLGPLCVRLRYQRLCKTTLVYIQYILYTLPIPSHSPPNTHTISQDQKSPREKLLDAKNVENTWEFRKIRWERRCTPAILLHSESTPQNFGCQMGRRWMHVKKTPLLLHLPRFISPSLIRVVSPQKRKRKQESYIQYKWEKKPLGSLDAQTGLLGIFVTSRRHFCNRAAESTHVGISRGGFRRTLFVFSFGRLFDIVTVSLSVELLTIGNQTRLRSMFSC